MFVFRPRIDIIISRQLQTEKGKALLAAAMVAPIMENLRRMKYERLNDVVVHNLMENKDERTN